MNMNELGSQSEKYKREMMKLYSRRTPMEQYSQSSTVEKYTQPSAQEKAPKTEDFREITGNKAETPKAPSEEIIEETNNLQNPISESIEEGNPQAPDDTAWVPYSKKENDQDSSDEEKFNARYPDPDISVLEGATDTTYTPPIYDSVESLGKSTGYIKVNVRTGYDSSAIEGASVTITAIVDGNRMIIAAGVTDSCGSIPKFAVPAPELSLSQAPGSKVRPYNIYDVSVSADGFFNARSVDVPVFSGTTSVQDFEMVPLPILMNPSDETVTYYNQEPDYLTGKE